jgi:hypothetical protein
MQYFYDGQIRRYITQMVRLLSNFNVSDSHNNLTQIPVMYGDLTRQVANIIRDNSENKIPSVPRIAVYVTGLEMDRERTGDSSFVNKISVRERAYDSTNEEYLNTQGKNYTVERLMPSPYTLRLQADIWASNTEQKLQILEQILVLFNPSFEIQTTDNYLDWTSLSVVNLDNVTFSSRSIPVGVDSEIDVANMQFSTPIYLTPPAKVKRLGVVTNIITSIFNEDTGSINLGLTLDGVEPIFESTRTEVGEDGEEERIVDDGQFPNDGTGVMDISAEYRWAGLTSSSTYRNYGLNVIGSEAEVVYRGTSGEVTFTELLDTIPGTYTADVSKIYLKTDDSDNYVIGTITINALDNTKLSINFDNDTLPNDTVITGPTGDRASIDYIIDPLRFDPNQDKSVGIRILLLGAIGDDDNQDGADAWKNTDGTDFVAQENDIVEWDGSRWHIIFDSNVDDSTTIYTSNLTSGIQYKWDNANKYWVRSYEGEYYPGTWTFILDA